MFLWKLKSCCPSEFERVLLLPGTIDGCKEAMCSLSVLEDIHILVLGLSAFKSGAYVWLANVSIPKPNRDIDKLDSKKGEIALVIFMPHWSQIRSANMAHTRFENIKIL